MSSIFPKSTATMVTILLPNRPALHFTGVYIRSVAWGDYDNDGDLDILLTGRSSTVASDYYSKIYRNNGNNTFTEQTSINLTGVY